jgi:hypothetical protein
MKYFSFILFVTIVLFMGCNDTEGILEIKGKVLDENSKVTIPRRAIIIQALIQSDNKLEPVHAGQIYSDSSGCFTYTLRKVKNAGLYDFCLVGDSAYAFSSNKLGLTELKQYGKFLTFYLKKLTDFTITIERKSKTPVRDTLRVLWESNGIDGRFMYPYKIENYGIEPGIGFTWIGGDIKSAIITKAYADKNTIVSWELLRNGKKKEFTNTIFCIRDASNYVNFKY